MCCDTIVMGRNGEQGIEEENMGWGRMVRILEKGVVFRRMEGKIES